MSVHLAGADVGQSNISRPLPDAQARVNVLSTGTSSADVNVEKASKYAFNSDIGLKPSYSDGNMLDQSVKVKDFLPEEAEEDV
jgi:hypothetical protein